ncbi:hypothetical protein GCM10022263_07640 [Nocardioides daeguensis]|uniref:Uncharacterized protein n=1 Tax=Nocardioides daeguensis TaxID=908359 RepID=A0ABP6UWX5_9ACTN
MGEVDDDLGPAVDQRGDRVALVDTHGEVQVVGALDGLDDLGPDLAPGPENAHLEALGGTLIRDT